MIDKAITEGRKLTAKLLESPMSSVATLLSFLLVFLVMWIGADVGEDVIKQMAVVSEHERQRIENDRKGIEVTNRFAAAVEDLNQDEGLRQVATMAAIREHQAAGLKRAESLGALQRSIEKQNELLERIYLRLDK